MNLKKMHPRDAYEYGMYQRADLIDAALAKYGGELPYRCSYCGTVQPKTYFVLRSDVDILSCQECRAGHSYIEQMTEDEFAEHEEIDHYPVDPEDMDDGYTGDEPRRR